MNININLNQFLAPQSKRNLNVKKLYNIKTEVKKKLEVKTATMLFSNFYLILVTD